MQKGRIVAGVLLVELLICMVLGYFSYRAWQHIRFERQRSLATKISKESIEQVSSPRLQYYYTLKPDTVEQIQIPWLGYAPKMTFNHDGLNERLNYPITKQPNTLRIMALGDSFTYGHYVDTTENWTEQLEVSLNQSSNKLCDAKNIEVINLGMTGFDTEYILERYKMIGQKYHPDVVVWMESGSGFTRVRELMEPLIKECEEKKDPTEQEKIAAGADIKYDCWRSVEAGLTARYSPEEIKARIGKSYRELFALTSQIPTYLFTYEAVKPADAEIMRDRYMLGYPQVHFETTIPSLTAKTRLADGHPNKLGHQEIMTAIQDYLENHQMEFCPKAAL